MKEGDCVVSRQAGDTYHQRRASRPPLRTEALQLDGYYVLKFNRPFKQYGTWKNLVSSAQTIAERGSNVGGYLEFEKGTKEIEIRIGSSFISIDQAADNLSREIPEQNNFETVSSNVKKQE
ncbi:hypothetical protein MASR1M31_20010 [Porphyromonadaceae bacterium]